MFVWWFWRGLILSNHWKTVYYFQKFIFKINSYLSVFSMSSFFVFFLILYKICWPDKSWIRGQFKLITREFYKLIFIIHYNNISCRGDTLPTVLNTFNTVVLLHGYTSYTAYNSFNISQIKAVTEIHICSNNNFYRQVY